MKVRLLYEWMGNPPGVILDLLDHIAKSLIERGIATDKEFIPEEKLRITEEELKRIHRNGKIDKTKKPVINKIPKDFESKMKKNSQDKMMRKYSNKGI